MTAATAALAIPRWALTPGARDQIESRGIDLAEVFRLLEQPQLVTQQQSGRTRLSGYGLTLVVRDAEILSVGIDGADPDNWEGWARERAEFGDSDIHAADALVRRRLTAVPVAPAAGVAPKPRRRPKPVAHAVNITHILDRVHPRLRRDVARLVAGDWSRLVIHSRTNVTVNPPRSKR